MNKFEKLLAIQTELKAPKGQYNTFGKYKYRSCEDILEAVKPLLTKHKATVYITDSIKQIGERYYIEATAHFVDVESGESIEVTAYAREEESKKGMDGSQVTGASSSYARKYALNGMFDIDDTKDSDATNEQTKEQPTNKPTVNKPTVKKPTVNYRTEYINLCKEKGIDSIEYAKSHGINKNTTQEQYNNICQKLRSENAVTMNDI